ncbi:MAG: radical SAM protein [Thermoguttaceae bacterium]
MKTYFLNPTLNSQERFIREGRCMQKSSSWATPWPPISLATLAAIAKKHGPVCLVDGNVEKLTLEDVIRDVREQAADLIVVNTGFPSIDGDMRVAKAIKEAVPQAKVAAFGVYFTMLEREGFENYPFLDFAMLGEPEDTLDELLAAMATAKTDYSEIRGLAWRSAGAVTINAPRPLIEDLDRLPIPDRSLLKNDRYRLPHNNRTFTLIPSGRGCPYPCVYCIVNAYYGRKARKRSVDGIIREVQECVDKYGIEEFLFWEEVFTLDRDYVLDVCHAIEAAGLKIRWAATTRVTSVEEELLRAMKRAGCYLLGLGCESGSQTILDNAKKRQTLDDTRRAVACCKKVGIETMGHFIFGLPGETRQTAEETMRFMLSLGLDYMQCYCAVPYPKTELGDLARANGWIRADRWSQYDFGGDSIMNTDQLTCEEVTRFRQKAFRRFYLRPTYVIRQMFRHFSIAQWLRMAKFTSWMRAFDSRRSSTCRKK